MRSKSLVFIFIALFALAGCVGGPFEQLPTLTETSSPTSTPTLTVTPTLTHTPLPPVGVLLVPSGAEPNLSTEIQSRLSQWIPEIGYRFQVRPSLNEGDLEIDDFQLVIALPPNPEIGSLILNHPEINFLTIGIQGLEPSPNLSTLGTDGDRLDYQGFIAGYMAAMITPDWRVGVIGYSESEDTIAARQAFFTGVKFYCGLCRPSYPPYYEYPLFFELDSDADSIAWRSAADFMIHREVNTVYVVPGAGDDDMLRYIASAEVNIIAGEEPLPELSEYWVASLRFDLLETFIKYWPEFVSGVRSDTVSTPLYINNVNPELLSPGKQRLVEATLEDVMAGFIDLGVSIQEGP